MTENDNEKITETIILPNEIKGEELGQILSLFENSQMNKGHNKIFLYKDTTGGEGWFLITDIESDKIYDSIEIYAKHEVHEFGLPILLYEKNVSPLKPKFRLNHIAERIREHILENEKCKKGIKSIDKKNKSVTPQKDIKIKTILQNEHIYDFLKKFEKRNRRLDKFISNAEKKYKELILYNKLDERGNNHIGLTIGQLKEGYQKKQKSIFDNDIFDTELSYDILISQTDILSEMNESYIEKLIYTLPEKIVKNKKFKKELYSFAESLDEEEFPDIFSIIIKESMKSYCKIKGINYKEMLIYDGNLGRIIQSIKTPP